MITLRRSGVALVAIVAVVLPTAAAVGAAEPTLSDIASCNQQAAQKTGASALPAQGGVPVAGAGRAGAQPAQSGLKAGEKTDPTGSFITQSPDPLLRGMDADKAEDTAYREAYRACMRAKTAG